MQNRIPTRIAPDLDFEPVPRKYRHDGWTPERQRAFIAALADTGSVSAACRRINMSAEGAYYLRRAPGAESFRAAWTAALDHGVQQLVDIAIDRAREGIAVPIFHKGEQVGEKRWFNDRLLMFMLKHHMPNRYGGQINGGTRSRETVEREAAENCPTCRATREAEAEENSEEAVGRWLDEMMKRYLIKLRQEHESRREGRWAAADLYLRQLTHLELILDIGGRSAALIDHFAWRPGEHGRAEPLYASPLSEALAEKRLAFWEAAGDPPRPPVPLHVMTPDDSLMGCGSMEGMAARHRARREAEAKMKEAQEQWEAARTAESWAAWLADKPA